MHVLRRSLLACLLTVTVTGCASRNEEASTDPDADSTVPPHYQPFFDSGLDEHEEQVALAALPFQSISLSRSACFGPCPVYTVTFRSDLTATLVAESNLDPDGTSEGEIDSFDYGRLCYLIESIHFSAFKKKYNASWTDDATATVTVTSTDGRQTIVSDYGSAGPIELWALIAVIDHIRENVDWQPANNEPPPLDKL